MRICIHLRIDTDYIANEIDDTILLVLRDLSANRKNVMANNFLYATAYSSKSVEFFNAWKR